MASLPSVTGAAHQRARRWDAVVLGSGVSALVAACRLGAAGQRVLVVEEDLTRALHPALREPFCLAGARDAGVLDACLRELNIPLIDQRRVAAERLAYQIVSDKYRLDIGSPAVTARELDLWGLCEAETAGSLLRALAEATEAERRVMLAAPVARIGRRISLGRSSAPGSHVRGLPADVASPPPALAPVLAAQVAALSNLPRGDASPEARARLLGCALAGGAGFADSPPWLLGLLRRRVEAVYGEFRSVSGRFDLVEVAGQAAVALPESGDLWVGRALLIAVPPTALNDTLVSGLPADLLGPARPRRRRLAVHLRMRRDVVPAGMCPRVILMPEAAVSAEAGGVVSVTAFPSPEGGEDVDLVARTLVDETADLAACEAAVEARVRALIPFSEGRFSRRPVRRPRWDDEDGWLEEPAPGSGWPAETDLRVSARPAVYRLDRAEVAGLGLEGDLLLGWRAGDAIAAELS